MTKKIHFGSRPQGVGDSPQKLDADAWIDNREIKLKSEPIKRLTVDLPASLHSRFKTHCAIHGIKMIDILRNFIEKTVDGSERY
jgi:hypothetical protein